MPRSALLLALFAVVAVAAEYQITLDGKPCEPDWVDLGDGPHPGPGDLLWVRGWLLVAEAPGRYDLALYGEDRLRLARDGGQAQVVGVRLEAPAGDPAAGKADPLAGLTRAQLAQLRCLCIATPLVEGKPLWTTERLDPEALDWSRLTVLIERMELGERANPLPEPARRKIRYLATGSGSAGGGFSFDLAELATGGTLLYAELSGRGAAPIRGEWLASHRGLRRLGLSSAGLAGTAALSGLAELRHLDLRFAEEPLDLAFAAGLRNLESASFHQVPLGDLGPLLRLPRLATIVASGSPIAALPAIAAPSLRRLETVGCGLKPEQIAAFTALNPRTEVRHSYTSCLREMAAQADSLVLRTGGTCHRDLDSEKVLHRTADRDEIALFAASLEIDEGGSGFHCMCCGGPSLEFRRGDGILASFGVHHGRSLRWSGASDPWPGDGLLTGPSAASLCAWLAAHGDDGPLRELQEEREREAASERMRAAYRDILGAGADAILEQAENQDAVQAALAKRYPAANDRALGLLRLFGAGRRSWSGMFGIDELVEKLEAAAVAPVAEAALAQPDGCDGLARWAFELDRLETLAADQRAAIGPRLAARALADPRAENRRTTLLRLDACREPWATEALRSALAGIAPRPLAEAERTEPGGQVVYRPHPWSPPRQASDRAIAAAALGRRGDAASLPAIKALAAGAGAEDGKLIFEALTLLQQPQPAP